MTSVLSRTLTETGSDVVASDPVTLGTDHNQDVPLALASSGDSTIYTTPGSGQDFNVTIVTPRGAQTLRNALHGYSGVPSFNRYQVALSKKWAMWTTRYGPLTVMNRTTSTRTTVVDKPYLESAALSGHYLAYNTKHGDVLRRNLNTGNVVTVYAPKTPLRLIRATVATYGGWVGWHFGLPGRKDAVDGMRNISGKSKTIQLPDQLYALSSVGALLRSGSTGYPTATELQPYAGKLKALLPAQYFNAMPRIAGQAIAWVTSSGQLELAQYPA